MRAVLFDFTKKKDDQRKEEMSLSGKDRLELCFELIDLTIAVSKEKRMPPAPADGINWIELSMKK